MSKLVTAHTKGDYLLETPIESEVLLMEQSSELANQQGRFAAWFAGFVDGEGTFSFSIHWPTKRIAPRFQVCNTSAIAFENCKAILDTWGISYRITTQKLNKNWKVVWKIEVSRYKQIKNLIPIFLSYLIVKKRQAELVYEYTCQRILTPYHNGYTKDQIDMVKLVRQLNQRGPSETLRLPFDSLICQQEDKVHA